MNKTISSLSAPTLALLFAAAVVFPGAVMAADGYYTDGYDGGYFTGGYDGGYFTDGYDGGYLTGGYDGGYLTDGYDGGYLTGGYDGGYYTDGYDGGYFTGGYDGGYFTGGYDGGYFTDGYDGGYLTSGYDGGYYTEDYYTEEYVGSDSTGARYYSSSPSYSSGGGWYAPAPRSTGGGYSYSSPISVSSGRSYVQPSTPVVVSGGGGTTHNNNNNTNNNQNINNINVSATAIAIAPAAQPVAAYIPPAPVHPAPYCTISITNHYGIGYGYGQQTLTWNSTNAHSASINPIIGSVSTNGSRIVSNIGGQVYTMTVWGPGGSATCQTQPVYVPPVHVSTPTAPYVALSQIPYTGFDFGPVGNAMYWVSLFSVALAGAYLVVYYKGGALAFAGSMIGGRSETRSSRLAEFTPLPESAFAPAKKMVARTEVSKGYAGTTDAMSFIRSANGLPKIVINRA